MNRFPLVYFLLAVFTLLLAGTNVSLYPGWLSRKRNGVVFLGLFSFALAAAGLSGGHDWGGDFSQYIAQAKAIAEGNLIQWAEKSEWLYAHSTTGIGSSVYPWGVPVLLTPLYWIFGLNFTVFKLFEVICFAVSMPLLYLFFCFHTSRKRAFFLTLWCACNTCYLSCTNMVLADMPCFLFTVLSLTLMENMRKKGRTIACGILCGLSAFAAYSCRSLALSIITSWFLVDAIDLWKKLRAKQLSFPETVLYSVPYFTCLFFMIAFRVIFPSGSGYGNYFAFDLKRMAGHLLSYVYIFRSYFPNYWSGYFDHQFLIFLETGVFLLLAVKGMIRKRGQELFQIVYILVTMLVLLLFAGLQGHRYILGVFPSVLYFAMEGMDSLNLDDLKKRIVQSFVCASLAVMLLYDMNVIVQVRRGQLYRNESVSEDAVEMYDWINEHLSDESVIYFFKPRVLYLFTGVNSYVQESCPVNMLEEAEYVLISDDDYFCGSLLGKQAEEENWPLLKENSTMRLFEYKGGRP